jgi:hypothetical protein
MRLQAPQIDVLFDGFIRINNQSVTGSTFTATTPITTALNTAGRGGVSVPLQVATSTAMGIVTGVTLGLFAATTEKPILDASNNKVYAKLAESAGVYTLSFFSNISGTETAYSFASATNIDFVLAYRFDFARLPSDFAIAFPINDINVNASSGGGSGARVFSEKLTVTATNTLSALTFTPNFDYNLFLIVNGKTENTFGGGSAAFTRSVKNLTWSAANAGYSLLTTYDVVAHYTTLE